ncbi:hypothetical protein HC248_00492 [Polaromonas vacuolata]|uniref:Glycosyltransferase subfamily 4-like N-terminal domain-containing protein n=1 Tax=Polaromonas vacuolata TaxID=37448 RepID=A0A6H2H6I9_9BURK|nr:glycosyltransferase [Polaromonas vacuolata]QJC55214.1 hypothetical protein HC248_00492 [Polaromonas vacuolata]
MRQAANIFILGSYPCQTPMHGGQIRLAEIAAAYQRTGAQVRVCSVFDETSYANQRYGPYDHIYPIHSQFRQWNAQAIPLIDDLTVGNYAALDPDAYKTLSQHLPSSVDVLHFEQPWLLPLVLRWRKEGRLNGTRLVYGSQNIEGPLKASILHQYRIPQAEAVAEEISALERSACQEADLTLAVSESDRKTLQSYTTKPVLLAANGIAAWQAKDAALKHWKAQLPTEKFALFVASAHPPNISGFFDMFGDALGFIPPDTRLVVVGSVGPHLLSHPRFQRWLPLNQSRIQVLGLIDDQALAAVKTLAHLFVLPITEGGGSNIKTAEALYSGSHVLGTPVSFRGFDNFVSLAGVHQHAQPAAFRQAVTTLLQTPSPATTPATQALRQTLLWSNTLACVEDTARAQP